jgi:hypothetical protein
MYAKEERNYCTAGEELPTELLTMKHLITLTGERT